ncbi:MAG TPA: SAM-dependent methyltransferase [Acidimicrobiales bacterium]|nr:SAM-dependent methyltransferase [Acidimicrobiales bacterium]
MAFQQGRRRAFVGTQASLPSATDNGRPPVEIDLHIAHASRIYDYLLGGTNNFGVDQEMAEAVFGGVYEGGIDVARADVRANRAFLGRTVRHLVASAGIRQFLDIGTGIPTEDNVHEVAQRIAPEARIVYVDYDLIVQAHARLLLEGTPEGATAYITADLREPERILTQARVTLDLSQPVALMLVGILHVIPDADDAFGIVARLLDALAPGSHLVISHLASDINPEEMVEAVRLLNGRTRETFFLRDRTEIGKFFDRLDLLDPGVVPIDRWRPADPAAPVDPAQRTIPILGAVGRKP